mgnify:CR=1 FL=1
MIEVVEKCKYLLPCGRCDKFNRDCDKNIRFPTVQINCEHDLEFVESKTFASDFTRQELYRCTKCGSEKYEYIDLSKRRE